MDRERLAGPVHCVRAVIVLKDHGDASGCAIDGGVTGKLVAALDRRVQSVVARHPGDGPGSVAVDGIAKNLLDSSLGLADVENLRRRGCPGQR